MVRVTGRRFHITVWCVPRKNFPNGLPTTIAEHEVGENELKDAQRTGGFTGNADLSTFYLIDQVVPRELLSKSVGLLDFAKKSSNVATNERSHEPLGLARGPATGGSSGDLSPLPENELPATGGNPDVDSGPVKKRRLDREFSDPIPETDKTQKRVRILKHTLGALRDDLVAAADRQRWVPSTPMETENV